MSICYQIRVQGHLDPRWSYYFEGLEVGLLPTGETVLSGPVTDQAALHSLLSRIRDLGLPLLFVKQLPSAAEQGDRQETDEDESGEVEKGE